MIPLHLTLIVYIPQKLDLKGPKEPLISYSINIKGFMGRFASTKHSLAGGQVSREMIRGGGEVAS